MPPEQLLRNYRATVETRDFLVRHAIAAGLTKQQVHRISGISRTTIDAILDRGETPRLDGTELIFGYADELLAEHEAQTGELLDLGSLQGRLADTLKRIVRYVREESCTP